MKDLLNDDVLDGSYVSRVTYRPERIALPIRDHVLSGLFDAIRFESQVWGGATTALIPAGEGGALSPAYAAILPGSKVDRVKGLDFYGLFDLPHAKVKWPLQHHAWGRQLAVTLLKYRAQDEYRHLEIVELATDDPWRGVYAACLGLIPDRPDASVLEANRLLPTLRFEDFVHVERVLVGGSLDDLLQRLSSTEKMSPRMLSMVHLAYGNSGSTFLRTAQRVLPEPGFAQYDAGPNVVVVCSDGSLEDYALLWNLRGAHGDSRAFPVGIPASELNRGVLQQLAQHPTLARNGFPARSLYVTSASLTVDELSALIEEDNPDRVGVASLEEMLTFGVGGGWRRDEVLVWNNGEARFVSREPESHRDLPEHTALSDWTTMYVDLEVVESPFPQAGDVRVDAVNGTFYAGSWSRQGSSLSRSEALSARWPSRLLMAKSVAAARGFELKESEPGRAGLVALLGFNDIWDIGYLAHAPLLRLLDEMAARTGFHWFKQRSRRTGTELGAGEAVAPTADLLPEVPFDRFKTALGNSQGAARFWLLWAEKSGLIVKGFQLRCPICGAKQWTPVAGFAPPIICRGCAGEMATPFGDQTQVTFKYRISERLRRVYEHDTIGHLLVMYWFRSLFGDPTRGRMIGMHPGIEVRHLGSSDPEGEADVLLLMWNADFIPVEVKRSSSGFTESAVNAFNHLVDVVHAPWSAVAVCQYGHEVAPAFVGLEDREPGSGRHRVLLTYDKLLDPRPIWALGTDPFAWNPLTSEEIEHRESDFVKRLVAEADSGPHDMVAYSMLHAPSLSPAQSNYAPTATDASDGSEGLAD